MRPTVPQPKGVSDLTLGQIYELTDRLQQCLADAECVRARFTKAHDANTWPEMRGAVARLLADHDPPKH